MFLRAFYVQKQNHWIKYLLALSYKLYSMQASVNYKRILRFYINF